MFTFGLVSRADASLAQLVSIGKEITPSFGMFATLSSLLEVNRPPEGLHQKITDKAVNFLKALFAKSLLLSAGVTEAVIPLLSNFKKVHLWDLYVTNIPSEKLPTESVGTLYSVRWQIELVFKAAKSFIGLSLICGKRSPRVLCQIYGRLIVLVLTLFLFGRFRQRMWQKKRRELSLLESWRH